MIELIHLGEGRENLIQVFLLGTHMEKALMFHPYSYGFFRESILKFLPSTYIGHNANKCIGMAKELLFEGDDNGLQGGGLAVDV